MRSALGAFVLACLAGVATGCSTLAVGPLAGSAPGTLPGYPASLTIEAFEYDFALPAARITAGPVQLKAVNRGSQPHELLVVPVDGDRYGLPLTHVELRTPGEAATVVLNLERGTYALVCLLQLETAGGLASHLALGMIEPFEVLP